ncbi:ABC transporter ATP-binding protein [Spongorhabdus nitratireducens]
MIKIDNLKKSFGYFLAVDGITFNVGAGEVLGFLGPNGAGKSTTMKMISGFIKPTSGAITICGHDVLKNPVAAKELIGYLPEGAPAYADMTPLQYLRFIAEIRGFKGAEQQQRIDAVIEQLELQSVIHRPIDNLSKGFKRRVGIAQAILHDPQVLILDEPTDGLDPNQKHQVRELIRSLSRDKIVIISTHILEEVTAVCTRAIIIAGGRVLADATPSELEARSRYHGAVTLQLHDTPELEKQLAAITGVASVEVSRDNSSRYTLLPEAGTDIFNAVSDTVHQHGWQVDELFVERGHLDDVFRSLTNQHNMAEVA